MSAQKKTASQQTEGNNTYTFLRESITDLRIKPGNPINVKELTEYLKVSRSPVRDALIQLENEGLVTTVPKKGTFVSKIDVRRVRDERFLRSSMEEKAALEFIEICNQSHIDKMEKILEQQRDCMPDIRQFLRYDDDFHAVLFEALDHPYCVEIVHNMSGHYQRIRLLSLTEEHIYKQTLQAHDKILELIKEKKGIELQKLLSSHITDKRTEEETLMQRYPMLFTEVKIIETPQQSIWDSDFLQTIY